MSRIRLKDNHPTMVKLQKLFAYAEELGIGFTFGGQRIIVNDSERNSKLPTLYLEDIEEGFTVDEMPPVTDFKVIYEKD